MSPGSRSLLGNLTTAGEGGAGEGSDLCAPHLQGAVHRAGGRVSRCPCPEDTVWEQ